MLNDVTASIMPSITSPDPFTAFTSAQGEPVLISEKLQAPVVEVPILVLYGKCHLGSLVPSIEHRATFMKSVSDCVVRYSHQCPTEGHFVVLAASSLHKGTNTSLAEGLRTLSSRFLK